MIYSGSFRLWTSDCVAILWDKVSVSVVSLELLLEIKYIDLFYSVAGMLTAQFVVNYVRSPISRVQGPTSS